MKKHKVSTTNYRYAMKSELQRIAIATEKADKNEMSKVQVPVGTKKGKS